jgi:hypothetical protein
MVIMREDAFQQALSAAKPAHKERAREAGTEYHPADRSAARRMR